MKKIITIPKYYTVLIVEDNLTRIEWFRDRLRNMDVTVCTTVIEALAAIADREFDIVFLDHDAVPAFVMLGDPDHDQKTFYRVAEGLARQEYAGVVVIHSGNPVGAQRMGYLLGRSATIDITPFGMFDIQQSETFV